MATIESFTLAIPDTELERLHQKLSRASFPDEIDEAGWDYGAPLEDVKRLASYWKDEFNWREAESEINKLLNYRTTIEVEGFGPFGHPFPAYEKLCREGYSTHLRPGSFLEMSRLLSLLLNNPDKEKPSFHIIAPSLPNHGFSSGVKKRGFGLGQYAETCHKLMLSLGYEQYVSQGGDWGSTITRVMAQRYPSSLKACHLNLVPSLPPPITSPFSFIPFIIRHLLNTYTPAEQEGLERSKKFEKEGMGHYRLMTTKPQTFGYFLADSPVGLLAWMYEKLHDWSDEYHWTDDEICTRVSIYWFSKAGPAASARLYYESLRGDFPAKAGGYIPSVKMGLAYFPREIFRLPKAWGISLGEVAFEREHEKGGHFAAWELPESIAGDLGDMFGKGGGAYGVVEGKNGY